MIRQLPGSRYVPALVLVLALGVLAGVVELGSRHLQQVLREQMVNRDGEILYAVAQSQQFNAGVTNLAERLAKEDEQFLLLLEISQLKSGVLAVRLFDDAGKFLHAFPPNVTDAKMDGRTLARLQNLQPVSRYQPAARLTDLLLLHASEARAATNAVPMLEVNIPVHAAGSNKLLGCAQIILDAHDIQANAADLKYNLQLQALGVFAGGGVLLTAALLWAFQRLQKSSRLLEERTTRLLRANHELTIAAKTGALGAVTAHLIHGLSNPLANLQDFVATRSSGDAKDSDWDDALAATRRMQQLVHEVVRVLGEVDDGAGYEITLAELTKILSAKVQPLSQRQGVPCEMALTAEGRLSNHQANLILLILENLIHNALQVTPRGKAVQVSIFDRDQSVVYEVADQGPGFPPAVLKNIFTPCRSTKGGAGLGLAISKQLANHLGAQLELKATGPEGCVITLKLPRAVFAGQTVAATKEVASDR